MDVLKSVEEFRQVRCSHLALENLLRPLTSLVFALKLLLKKKHKLADEIYLNAYVAFLSVHGPHSANP